MISHTACGCCRPALLSFVVALLIGILSFPALAETEISAHTVHVGSFRNIVHAKSLLFLLREKGVDAICRYEEADGKGHWFRILAGRFTDRAAAQELAQRLERTIDVPARVEPVQNQKDRYTLHVRSYASKSQAKEDILDSSRTYVFEPFFVEEEISGKTWYRVYTGRFANEGDARRAGEALKQAQLISYFAPIPFSHLSQLLKKEPLRPAASTVTGAVTSGQQRSESQPTETTGALFDSSALLFAEAAGEVAIDGSAKKGSGPSESMKPQREATPAASAENGSEAADLIGRAEPLMQEGRAAEAYALLATRESKLAGNPDFDYLLAISALDSGNAGKASLVFERVLAVRPDFAGARLDMARAFYALGNLDQAKSQFEAVLKLKPPPAAKAAAERHLAAIEKRRAKKETTLIGYMQTTVGYDTNVNNSTEENQVYVPALTADLVLSPTNVETADSYGALAGGAALTHPISQRFSSYLNVDGSLRKNLDESVFDTISAGLRSGVRFENGNDTFSTGLKGQRFWLDDSVNRNTAGVEGDWRRLVNPTNQIVVFGQFNQNRYPDTQIEDVDQLLGGISWLHALQAPGRPVLYSSIYAGDEHDKHGRADGGKQFEGLRVGTQADLKPNLSVFANVGGQYGRYERENVAFLETRKDWLYDARLGLHWRPKENWTIGPQVTYTKNDTNISIYEYDRTDISMTFRRDFR